MSKDTTILKYVLQNSIKYNGKADLGSVIGKILSERPDFKKEIKKLQEDVKKVIKEVSKKKIEEQIQELKKIAPELLEKKEKEEKKIPELKNAVSGKLVTRFAPSPSGPLHIGHAYLLGLIHAYNRRYNGKLILRIEDTNLENIYPPAYDMIVEDANWLTNHGVWEVQIQSDNIDRYYYYAEKLIKIKKAYVCLCSPEEFKSFIEKKQACPHREQPIDVQLERWKKMFSEYAEGSAVLRIKTDINHKNPAMRDWAAMRIKDVEHGTHPRQGKKYRVWPLMNFAVAIDDIESGMTHIIRGKDHMDNAKKQEFLYDYLNKKIPETIFVGRINFKGMEVSCTKTKIKIEAGEFSGWDDIRLPFLRALRKRGYQPEAFIKYAEDIGPSQNDKTVSKEEFFKQLDAFNRDIISSIANRYFFIESPVKIRIKNAPEKICKLRKHPDYPERGERVFKTKDEFYITKSDYENLKNGKLYRLMDCLNFVKKGNEFIFDSLDYDKYKEKGDRIMHWLPVNSNFFNAKVVMADDKKTEVRGIVEDNIKEMKEGDVCQFERFGFVCLENKKGNVFWWAHK